MYDRVRLHVPRSSDMPDIVPALSGVTETSAPGRGIVRVCGNIRNLRVTVYPWGVVVDGSLAKYLNGNNVENIGRADAARALEEIGDFLHTNIGTARVYLLEFGRTFEMNRAPSDYIQLLGAAGRMKRRVTDSGYLLYHVGTGARRSRELVFYNKGAESGAPGNLLRYEMRYYGSLGRQLKAPGLTVATLTTPDFYKWLVSKYKYNYSLIKKQGGNMDTSKIREGKLSDISKAIFGYLLGRCDPAEISSLVERLRSDCGLSPRDVYRLKKSLCDAQELGCGSASGLVEELDGKIKAVPVD